MTGDKAMETISEILYPGGDLDREWSSKELEWIATVVHAWTSAR